MVVHKFSDDNFSFWVENNASVFIKAVTSLGDPVELNAEELNDIIVELTKVLRAIQ